MALDQILARIAQLETALAQPGSITAASLKGTSGSGTSSAANPPSPAAPSSFANTLTSALLPEAGATASLLGGGTQATPDASTPTSLESLLSADPSLAGSGVLSDLSALSGSGSLTGSGAVTGGGALAPTPAPGAGNQAIVSIAQSQVGVTEQPPGSNDSPAIATYRTATAGAAAGEPWCAYFASWVARQAGEPLGAQGQGFGAVHDIWSWAQQTGRAVTNGPGVVPQPGDLIVFGDQHVGIVDQVLPNGDIETIEGNYNSSVSTVTRSPTEATGYVRMS